MVRLVHGDDDAKRELAAALRGVGTEVSKQIKVEIGVMDEVLQGVETQSG